MRSGHVAQHEQRPIVGLEARRDHWSTVATAVSHTARPQPERAIWRAGWPPSRSAMICSRSVSRTVSSRRQAIGQAAMTRLAVATAPMTH